MDDGPLDAFNQMEVIRFFNLIDAGVDEVLAELEAEAPDVSKANWPNISESLRPAMKRAAVRGFSIGARVVAERAAGLRAPHPDDGSPPPTRA